MTQSIESELHSCPPVTARKRFAGKRVAMVTFSSYPHDPRPRRALHALLEEGASVDLVCLADDHGPRREVLDGINILRVPLKHQRGGIFGYAYQYGVFILISSLVFGLRSLARPYDLVYVHNMPDILVLSSMIPKVLGARVVLDLHDPMPELMMTIFHASPDSKSVRLLKRLEKWSMARADLVLTVNRACKRIFSSRSCPSEKIGVVMNSPDSRIFPFREATSDHSANQRGDRPFVVMYHGSIVERNGLDIAIDAIAQVRQAVPNAVLRVFGSNTSFLQRMMDDARRMNLEGTVEFCGPRSLEGIVKEIENCDLGLIPNHFNAFTEINTPTRIFEYLALGKPVIAPRTPGIQDYFSPESLLFFEPGNSKDLATRIEYVFSHPGETVQIVNRGQKVYLAKTWTQERQTLVNLLGGLVDAGKPQTLHAVGTD